jgi:ribose transport system substrate-binding protein
MKRRITVLALIVVGLLAPSMLNIASAAEKKYTIALIPGLTTDPFYITMHKGAEEAAKVLGVNLVFQGAPDFNPVTQVPVLNAIIGRKPDAIRIALCRKLGQVLLAELRGMLAPHRPVKLY